MNCLRPGCTGQIDDGFCNVCGLAPTPGASSTSGTGSSVPALSSASVQSGTGLRTRRTRGTTTTTTTVSRGNLGAGIVAVPPTPYRDPATVVLADPQVAESKRYCAKCDKPVGRSSGERPGRLEGFCPHCRTAYSFIPKLKPGDLVASQYDVAGCLAHGGLGWIYLARDHNVADRWVVLKGLLNSGDESAMAAAIAERQFLAEVQHPNIVGIYNFVEHEGAGYIVMEYVGGQSLKDLRLDDSGAPGPVPVARGIAYMLEALPALGYLHGRGLLYCDFKPDNVIQTEEQIRIIDLGGVRRIGDDTSDIYGTPGYQAPEVGTDGPSIASDLYTVARTLAVMVFDFRGFQNRYADALPPAAEIQVLESYPALHRFLAKGADSDPNRRFESASEMAEQLLGVLRQVVAIDGGQPTTAPSRLFSPELGAEPAEPDWRLLPVPAIDPTDPAAGVLTALATTSAGQTLTALEATPTSPEVVFQRVRAQLELGDTEAASAALAEQAETEGEAWRDWWWQGVVHLAQGRAVVASQRFGMVAAELPGELSPLLAIGVSAEIGGDLKVAEDSYQVVVATDPSYVSASFGLARIRRSNTDRHGAIAALDGIPSNSSAYQAARVATFYTLMESSAGGEPDRDDLVAASETMLGITGDPVLRAEMRRDLMVAALGLVQREGPDEERRVGGVALEEIAVRQAVEDSCRSLSKLAATESDRIRLIDEANFYRPRSLV
jgi:serine/threonine-protein kinase PknG